MPTPSCPTSDIKTGDWIQGPFWRNNVQVVSIQHHASHDVVTVHADGRQPARPYVLTPTDWEQIQRISQADRSQITFGGDPERFRLGIQAIRLRLAHAIDPYAALNSSRIDPLPHQFEAVYEHLLARPVVRTLLAHDAGAGKTIMAGMVIKELKRRQGARRILIVTPAGLTEQWRRELLTKFGEDFTVISLDAMQQMRLDSLDVWREIDLAITSVAFARQPLMRRALESVEWDAVIVDEAHRMAAYRRPNGSTDKTDAYKLGEILSRRATHFLLMTATPHKGDPDNYRLLLSLIDPQWGDAAAHAVGANPVVLRRTKEEMRKADGDLLYPERIVEHLHYSLSTQEGSLLEQVQKYVRGRYSKARAANRQSAAFALITLDRRLASSPYALRESLQRICAGVETRVQQRRLAQPGLAEEVDWETMEELDERERWQREAQGEADLASLVEPRQLQKELDTLASLLAKADAIVKSGQQAKLHELREACDLWVGQRGQQLIIFTEFKDTLDHLLDCLAQWGYTTTTIHGGMNVKERRAAEKTFWEGKAQVLAATEAAGEGINLQCCHVLINFDIPWNPTRLDQRMGRIHRYGQQASQVFIFNLIARHTMEGEVKQALIDKQKEMAKDLGADKVFDVVGAALWSRELRDALERVAQGDTAGKDEALRIIERAGQAAQAAIAAEGQTIASAPLDVAAFRRHQAAFRAQRLNPEIAERFFRQAVPFLGGALREFQVDTPQTLGVSRGAPDTGEAGETPRVLHQRPAFEVTLPPDVGRDRQRKLIVSFWPEACSDDDTVDGAVLYIAPGHTLLNALLDRVVARCAADLSQGAVFLDTQAESDAPALLWFVRSQVRDGMDRHVTDLLAALRHRADLEQVVRLPSEVLDGFDQVQGSDMEAGIHLVRPMLAGQDEVLEQCVSRVFLPELAQRRAPHSEALQRDQAFLQTGLTALAEHLSAAAVDAFIAGDQAAGERLTDQSDAAQKRLHAVQQEMARARHLLMVAPDVLGVALVLPAPVSDAAAGEPASSPPMRRDPAVEQAAMEAVMAYETSQHRHPRDVHADHSWDIESDDSHGVVQRYIEVKGRGPEDANEVMLTNPEWEAARRLGDQHWLYIVRLADQMMWRIQNPYGKLQPKEHKRWIVRIDDAAPYSEQTT